jgi:hypothetical protein
VKFVISHYLIYCAEPISIFMEAGIADHVWSLEEVVALMDTAANTVKPDLAA